MDKQAKCGTCVYWDEAPAIRIGARTNVCECHRTSPARNGWPETKRDDWCGKWQLDVTKANA